MTNLKNDRIISMKESELVEYRKANYWRGFCVCLFLVALPLFIFFSTITNKLLDLVI